MTDGISQALRPYRREWAGKPSCQLLTEALLRLEYLRRRMQRRHDPQLSSYELGLGLLGSVVEDWLKEGIDAERDS